MKGDTGDDVSSIVFVSMTFSVLSIIAASMSQVSRFCEKCRTKTDKLSHKTEMTGELTIKASDLHKKHAFAHNKISSCMSDIKTHINGQ